jgi:DNA-binding LytR/AlgR family response regulator
VADYLLKPFSFDRFRTAIDRARLALRARKDTSLLPVPLDRGRHEFVRIGDVVSLSADGDYVVIRTTAGKLYTLGPLTSWLDRLPTPPFLRVHRSHVVNVDHVTGVDGRTVRAGDETLPVSATHAGEVRAVLAARG